MTAQRKKMHGLNLNPLAPAQSKLAFPFSRKTRNVIENACICAPFFCPFVNVFHDFSLKSPEGLGSRPRVLKRHQNGRQRVTKWRPGVSKFNTKATKSVENPQHVAQGSQNGASAATMEPQSLHKCKTHIKNSPNLQKKHTRKVPQVAKQRRKTIYPQTTNQQKKQRGKQRNKRTNKHTHAQELRTANTDTNSRGRVLAEGDVDPAAGSPKEPFRLQGEAPERSEHGGIMNFLNEPYPRGLRPDRRGG